MKYLEFDIVLGSFFIGVSCDDFVGVVVCRSFYFKMYSMFYGDRVGRIEFDDLRSGDCMRIGFVCTCLK